MGLSLSMLHLPGKELLADLPQGRDQQGSLADLRMRDLFAKYQKRSLIMSKLKKKKKKEEDR